MNKTVNLFVICVNNLKIKKMIRVNVFIQVANHSDRDSVIDIAQEMVTFSVKEKGCIAYDIYESITRKDVFMICETWDTPENYIAHKKTDHFLELVPKIEEIAEIKDEKLNMI